MIRERCPYNARTLSASYKNLVPDRQESPHELYKLRDLHESDPTQSSVPDAVIVSIGDIRIEFGANTSDDTILRLIKAVRYA